MRRKEYQPIGKDSKYNLYHDQYDHLRIQSKVLNAGNINLGLGYVFWDEVNVRNQIKILVGDSNGWVKNSNGEGVLAKIPATNKELEGLYAKHAAFKEKRQKLGYADNDIWPNELWESKMYLEAKLDVLNEEKDQLQIWLNKFTSKAEQVETSDVLAYGLKQACKTHGLRDELSKIGQLKEIDGQHVSIIGDGVLIIDDQRSPYDGMSVPDYRALAKQWTADRRAADELKLKRIQDEARALGRPIPKFYSRPSSKVDKKLLPAWPKDVRNWKKEPPEEVNQLAETPIRIERRVARRIV